MGMRMSWPSCAKQNRLRIHHGVNRIADEYHIDLVRAHSEEPARLNDFESLFIIVADQW